MNLRKSFKALITSKLKRGYKFVNYTLLGIDLKAVKNTVRQSEDQDDAWWFYLAKNHNTIYDIGCNIGYTATLALLQNPNCEILLVDPNPKALQIAAINLLENGLGKKANFLAAFVGNSLDEEIKFYTVGAGAAGSMHATHAKTAASINSFLNARTVTLDYLYEFYNMKPDLIKIDVEGAETLVMESAKTLTKALKPTYFIEMHNVADLGMEGAAKIILAWSKEMDYKVWYLKTGEELINAKTIKNRGKCHLLLMPSHKVYPDYLIGIKQNSALPKII